MKSIILTLFFTFFIAFNFVQAQNGWSICNTPTFDNRVDDVFMVNAKVGYAASGDGQIVKTINGGLKWENLLTDASVYCRSVEFVNEKKGFVGGFPSSFATSNMLRKTIDGGKTWTDLTQLLNPKAARGICGLAAPDSNTIYGCGNWYDEEAYIVKSNDGGDSWSFIDMAQYASALIDMHFVSKDTGFATGRGPLPLRTSVVLYTTDGGLTWTYTFKNNVESQYCWKIQSLTNKIYFASIEDFKDSPPKMIKSTDGGFTWNIYNVSSVNYNVEGIGFIDTNLGWLGGGPGFSFVTKNGGETWAPLNNVCPYMNRIFRVNDTLLFAAGSGIWKYTPNLLNNNVFNKIDNISYAFFDFFPNPIKDKLTVNIQLSKSTQLLLCMVDETGKMIYTFENKYILKGDYQYDVNTSGFNSGLYYLVLKTHEDKQIKKIVMVH